MVEPITDSSDEALAARAATGEAAAFETLVDRYQARVYRLACRLTSETDAPDVLQETFLQVHRNLRSFRGDARFSTWLYRIATNPALSIVRRRVPEPVEDPASHLPTPERWHEHSVVDADMVQRALEKIPPDFRSALVLREYAGMSYQEIAETLGIKPETAKTRISRARKALTALLEIS